MTAPEMPSAAPTLVRSQSRFRAGGGLWMLAASLGIAVFWLLLLESLAAANVLISRVLWQDLVHALGGRVTGRGGEPTAAVPFMPLLGLATLLSAAVWLVGAGLIAWRSESDFRSAREMWGRRGALWSLVAASWSVPWFVSLVANWAWGASVMLSLLPYWVAASLAGGIADFLRLGRKTENGVGAEESVAPLLDDAAERMIRRKSLLLVAAGVAVYVAVFTTMNWRLYQNLLVPHGDSAMYEEHLWNLLHGKGFRSYLDPGLFLGEHIQVIHVLLVPLYLIWPSHLLLELCESLALGLTALPLYSIALRHTGSRRIARRMAYAALLFVPLHFLDIAIDQKTFRPNALGVPLLLLAIDLFERRRFAWCAAFCALSLTAQEDYALVLAPLGLWMALSPAAGGGDAAEKKRVRWFGAGLCVASTVYLLLALTVLIPYFREGNEAHYASYFSSLGESPGEIVVALLKRPGFLLGSLFGLRSILAAVALLAPLGGLALRSPGRLAIALPMFGILSLIQLSGPENGGAAEALIPYHHFHAPLTPIVLWASAAGLACLLQRRRERDSFWPSFVVASAWGTALFLGLSPLGIRFWDYGSLHYWKTNYVISRRAELFPRVLEAIPRDARVASTDFVHPRFTHFERSYDYSHYRRRVAGWTTQAPDDTDYIVIDTGHRYSEIKHPLDVPELRDSPDRWELLPIDTEGYFVVLKRRDL